MPSVHDDLAPVVPLYASGGRRHQAARRRAVRAALVDADRWIAAGLDGTVSLEEAVCSAQHALGPAVNEVMEAALA